ncbi:uncharacterized protein HKW66_Vig0135270 [Vigna angularis]|uniref:Uncharacterized protein n=2 Tax=Phaseolus angularis TaxID=3914 RepID=A0A8T0KED3_PHAAN|nr:uncharacterized protein HKW66_Vig0135270 [Vigna angularis]BAT91319.1 hypothetical protein VIGAN_06263900 [Vigna angularis var. angularis]
MASKTKRSTSLTWLLLLFISLLFSFSAKAIAARNLAANYAGSDDERSVSRRGLGSSPCKRGRETSEVAEGERRQGVDRKPYDDPRCHNYL